MVEPTVLRAAFGQVPSAVVALAAVGTDGRLVGMALSSFVPISLEPALVGVCLQTTSRTWRELRLLPRLGLSTLAEQHGAVARGLAAREGDRFAGVAHTVVDGGAIRIDEASAFFECSLEAETTVGDHLVAVLRVHRVDCLDARPLVFHRSSFTALA